MALQIFGTRKCALTRKAERFFKERHVDYHFVDLADKGISPGELKAVLRAVKADDLIDSGSKRYLDRGLAYMDFDIEAELIADPLLLRTPVVRDGSVAFAGDEPKAWADLATGKR
jgi:arsenate reductase-like glutaredoxin family protein